MSAQDAHNNNSNEEQPTNSEAVPSNILPTWPNQRQNEEQPMSEEDITPVKMSKWQNQPRDVQSKSSKVVPSGMLPDLQYQPQRW